MTTRTLNFSRAKRMFLLALMLACFCLPAQAKRKDIVIMKNDDHFTGEIKRLQNGLLYIETDYVASNIGVDWNQVKSVQSTATYQVVLTSGRRLQGIIGEQPGENGKTQEFSIRDSNNEVKVLSADVVSLEITKPTFIRQLTGSIDVGYSFSSGNSQSSLNVDTNAAYQTPTWGATAAFDATFGGQTGATQTNREDLQGTYSRYLNRNSFIAGIGDLLHSSQQDLDLRATVGGGYGRYFKRTTNTSFSWLGGVVYTHELFNASANNFSDSNMEAVIGLQYNTIRFKFGDLSSQLLVFPGLTIPGRLRLTTNNSLSIKLTNNFRVSFTFWDNFDNKPPTTARKNELGISSGIGWSF